MIHLNHALNFEIFADKRGFCMNEKQAAGAATTAGQYAIFETGGKQYQGIPGKTVAIEKIEGEIGATVEFSNVMLRRAGAQDVQVGTPYLEKPITASIIRQDKGPKVTVFHFKRRKKHRVKHGHRQLRTVVRIESI